MAENWWEAAPKAEKPGAANWWEAAPKANAAPAKDEPGLLTNLAAGAVKGASRIGATLLSPLDAAARAVGVQNEWIGRTDRGQAVDAFMAEHANPDSLAFKTGDLGTQIAGTMGVGGAVAAPLRAVAPLAGRAAPALEMAARTISSGGFNVGKVAPVAGAGTVAKVANAAASGGVRMAGGAVNGGISAGLVNPDELGTGAAWGAALPPALMVAGKAAGISAQVLRSLRAPKDANEAARLAEYLGVPADDLMAALQQQGPQMIPGYKMTVPQILQTPEASQLQRTLKSAGANALGEAERGQQAQFRQALNRVAPVDLSVNDAANRAGSAIQSYATPARQEATERVRQAFDGVDPFNETQLYLPIEDMEAAAGKFLGDGTFGTGGKAQAAIDTARRVGTETIDEIKPVSAKGLQDLVLAVRAAGGINTTSKAGQEMAGEIRNLRESGLNNLVKPNTGKSVERMAETMHEAGFLPDNDPATLLNLLHESAGGNKIYAGAADNAYQAAMEAAQGTPPPSGTFAKTVPFQTVQNLRSSIGEAAEQARAKGANKEAAALEQMKSAIDARINRAADGAAEAGESFPKDVADQYRKALALHEQKMLKFETGPQYQMFRKGADGLPAIQGAEIPRKFYNGNASQVEDMQSLKRLLGNRQDLLAEMKRYAITEGANTSNAAGDLTSKFTDWLLSRSGANRQLFDSGELATLQEVGKAVERQMIGESLGRVSGSDTAQKLASLNSTGLLDNKAVGLVANKVPFGGAVLGSLRESTAKRQRDVFARLMADPDQFATALGGAGRDREAAEAIQRLLQQLEGSAVLQSSSRAAPVLLSDQ